MQLHQLSNQELILNLKTLIKNERELLTQILLHLQEVNSRKLHLGEGYGSLFEYATQALGYSEAQAYRRISAMHLLQEIPELQKPIQSGAINLTHLTQAKEYFQYETKNHNPPTQAEKILILKKLENKSTRETEKIFATLNPKIQQGTKKHDQEVFINAEQVEIRFVANQSLLEKIKHFKMIDSHHNPHPNYEVLLERLLDIAIKFKTKNNLSEINTNKPKPEVEAKANTTVKTNTITKTEAVKEDQYIINPTFSAPKIKTRYIPLFTKRIVFNRDEANCSFISKSTGKRCNSRFQLELDHRTPFAKNGDHSVSNLRILCKAHNLYMAEQVFGKYKIPTNRFKEKLAS